LLGYAPSAICQSAVPCSLCPEMVQELDTIDEGALALSPKDRETTMHLCYAAAACNTDELKVLLEAKHNPNLADYSGKTPLHIAASTAGGLECARLLLEHRSKVNIADISGHTPLSLARQARHSDVQQLLQASGAKVQQIRLERQATDQLWRVDRKELTLGKELSTTLKSVVNLAEWRGTEVVVKSAKIKHNQMLRAFSNAASATSPKRSHVIKTTLSDQDMKTTAPETRFDDDVDEEALHDELLHEIELLASIRHPDLVMFLGACLEARPIMFVSEYMTGGDLERYYVAKRRSNNGDLWRPSASQVIDWSMSIARALSFLHNCTVPIVHRDLKPLNLLLTKNLDLKMTDFGISKMMSEVQSKSTYKMTGGVGSWLYMAPEVVRYQNYDEKVDIYSFGLIMYFMSSGRDPFHEIGRDPELVLKQYLEGKEPRPSVSECHLPLRAVMGAAWHVEASSRPSSHELLKLLGKLSTRSESSCNCSTM